MVNTFGKIGNKVVKQYTLENSYVKAEILNYGGIIRSLTVGGVDVVCGFDDIESYLSDTSYQGAVIGRYANRISAGVFTLNGVRYALDKNEGGVNHLHGGKFGFDKRLWDAVPEESSDGSKKLRLSLLSPDGEEGYPGNLSVSVVYILYEKMLLINYYAVCDRDTPLNMTNHAYFNICGYGSGDIYSHKLKINAEHYFEVDDNLIPVLKAPVAGTPFDFRIQKEIGRDIRLPHKQLKICGGYDHNFFIEKNEHNAKRICDKTLYEAVELACCEGRMHVYTDMPCIQLYTGNFLDGGDPFKDGVKQKKHHALCLETQYAPDSPNRGEAILKAGETYDKSTAFVFE